MKMVDTNEIKNEFFMESFNHGFIQSILNILKTHSKNSSTEDYNFVMDTILDLFESTINNIENFYIKEENKSEIFSLLDFLTYNSIMSEENFRKYFSKESNTNLSRWISDERRFETLCFKPKKIYSRIYY